MDADNKNKNSSLERHEELLMIARGISVQRRFLFLIVGFFLVLGLFLAIFSEKEYKASVLIIPETGNNSYKLGSLSSIASLGGFKLNMDNQADRISPVIYPKLMKNGSFQLELMNSFFDFEEFNEEKTLFDYYSNEYQSSLFTKIKKYITDFKEWILGKNKVKDTIRDLDLAKSRNIIRFTEEQDQVRKIIQKNLVLSVNEQEGYFKITATFHQPYLSAQIVERSFHILQNQIISLRIKKAQEQYSFIEGRFLEKRDEMQKAQSVLAAFRDQNSNITSALLRTREEQLENEYQLAYNVFSELAGQLEQAAIKVKEDTPVFSIIENVVVPNEKYKPKRMLIMGISLLLGIITGISIVILRIVLRKYFSGNEKSVDEVKSYSDH